ncbi:uncharacterized protein LOC141714018 [Apium graveolens]|uniref:uncharacterized protein LOC141714018 n=1 Tax=Apium graveolens TaxID=4045 RepID=UPI003D79FA8B
MDSPSRNHYPNSSNSYHLPPYIWRIFSPDSLQIVDYPKFPKSLGESNTVLIVCVAVKDSFYLWNPAIRQYKVIPPYSVCRNIRLIRDQETLGFIYDQIDHDFKVVRFVKVGDGFPPSFLGEVYSANTNVWRKSPDPIDIPTAYFDASFNGFLCGTKNFGDSGMLAFDLNKQVLNCDINLPFVGDNFEGKHRLIEFDKSLVVFVIMDDLLNGDCKIKMWMLDDDACLGGVGWGGVGGEASWTPLFVTSIGGPSMIVHGFFNNRDIILMLINELSGYVWISCNVDKKEAKIIPLAIDMKKHGFCSHIYKYTESLVTLPGFRQVSWNAGADVN